MRRLGACAALTLAAVWVAAAPPAHADHGGPAASQAEAYGLLVDAVLLDGNVPVEHGPVAWAAQSYPPGADEPAEADVLSTGPVPAGGELVENVGVLTSVASADEEPVGIGIAEAIDVGLLVRDGEPQITADLVRAHANTDCEEAPNGPGTAFVNLKVGDQTFDEAPPPNTVIDLQIAKVILNEQRPAFDGRGIIVNAIHVVSTGEGDALFRGDIVVAHAMSTVHCPGDGPGTTGEDSVLPIVKTVTPDEAHPGDEITYTATITNNADEDCLVNMVIDHLPIGFELVSTAGDLGDEAEQQERPDGGIDVAVGNGVTIASGESVTQTFTVKIGDDVAPGTYFNNVEVFCANLGNFIKGLDAPVTVTQETATTTSSTTTTTTDAGELPAEMEELPKTGELPVWPLGLLLLAAGVGIQRARAAASNRDL